MITNERSHTDLLMLGSDQTSATVGIKRQRSSIKWHQKRSSMDGTGKKDVSIDLGKALWPAMSALGGTPSVKAKMFEVTDNLHLMARTNEARRIREFANDREISDVKERMMNEDDKGNTPPMVAALHNNKEALLALLGPFFGKSQHY